MIGQHKYHANVQSKNTSHVVALVSTKISSSLKVKQFCHVAIECESNTPFDSTTNLINATETSNISTTTSPNAHHRLTLTDTTLNTSAPLTTNKESSSNPDQDTTNVSLSLQQPQDNLINLSGWSVVASWKNENFQMNEHQNAYLEKMFASEIFPRVYLGTQMAATDKAWLEDHNVTHILTISDGITPAYPESYTYKVIPIRDFGSQNIIVHFENTHKFIHSALQEDKGNILIHCQAGISRAPTVMIAYIMKTRKMTFEAVLEFVISKRPIICPNLGFRQQLKLYESLGCQKLKSNPKYWGFLVKKWSDRLLL
ncbi:2636_t:CDS:2 [Funneliformis mosseae]|uniref:protein-tyrosine-phosphatase n=1 Tax=Funneliformis mosseae TaxID=27381 RepID=A0A9N8V8F9_FUNMO|nr:2636_t:CDS:2 [Funneliformis mosseae]